MVEPSTQVAPQSAGITDPSRIRSAATLVAGLVLVLSVTGSFATGATGAIAYVVALCVAALVILLVAMQHPRQARAWRFVGGAVTFWAAAGFLLVLSGEAGISGIPPLAISVLYALGYPPLLLGLADLCDPQRLARRFTTVVDGVLLFLGLYAVLWLTVVEQVTADDSLSKVDRAFSALYPAGDLAVLMLTIRIVTSRAARRRVGVLLVTGATLSAVADVALLIVYLSDPYGVATITDLLYLLGLGAFAVAAVWSLLPAPPPVPAPASSSSRLALTVAISSFAAPSVLLAIALFTDRQLSVTPIAVWLLLAALAAVLRHVASVKELAGAHRHSAWLSSHDLATDMLSRQAFLAEMSEGTLRDRSGTVLLVEALSLRELRDARGYDAVDFAVETIAARVRTAAGDSAVMSRLAHDQLAVFMRAADLHRGRQLADAIQRSLATGATFGDVKLELPAIVGVAQADGGVIDVPAAVRRAGDAVRRGRVRGAGFVAVDADLTGTVVAAPGVERPQPSQPVTTAYG